MNETIGSTIVFLMIILMGALSVARKPKDDEPRRVPSGEREFCGPITELIDWRLFDDRVLITSFGDGHYYAEAIFTIMYRRNGTPFGLNEKLFLHYENYDDGRHLHGFSATCEHDGQNLILKMFARRGNFPDKELLEYEVIE